jgi:hypothetical protein
MLRERLLSWLPHSQVSDFLPIGCLIVVGDQAYHCCIISKLNDGVGVAKYAHTVYTLTHIQTHSKEHIHPPPPTYTRTHTHTHFYTYTTGGWWHLNWKDDLVVIEWNEWNGIKNIKHVVSHGFHVFDANPLTPFLSLL